MRSLVWVWLLVLLAPTVLGATLTGTAYTQNLAVAQFAILTINTTPEQQLILEDGSYNITVPTGTYVLRASLRQSGQRYEDEVLVRAVDNGTYEYDLILFQVDAGTQDALQNLTTDIEFPNDTVASATPLRSYVLGTLILVALVVLAFFGSRRRWWEHKSTTSPTQPPQFKTAGDLPDDLAQVVAILKSEGGRLNQKELRQKLPLSEAKVSMMLADLEARGVVKRVKQGRGNLIVLR